MNIEKMKILHISTFSSLGGAARATYRVSNALSKAGINSEIFSLHGSRKKSHELKNFSSTLTNLLALTRMKLDTILGVFDPELKRVFHTYAWLPENTAQQINSYNPDIVHLHWVGGGFLRPESLSLINAPIVWTMHDLWPALGAEHYPANIKTFSHDYRVGHITPLNKWLFQRKGLAFSKKTIRFIAPSTWIKKQAQKSDLMINQQIDVIPNCLDTKSYLRDTHDSINGSSSKGKEKNILFIAMNADTDQNKGYHLLFSSLEKLRIPATLTVIGAKRYQSVKVGKVTINLLPSEHEEDVIKSWYKRADVTVVPSLIENLPYTAMESIASGTPVVAFDVGGNNNLVIQGVTGYLVEPYDTKKLAQIIEYVLESSEKKNLHNSCIKYAHDHFDNSVVARQHISLYKSLL